MATIELNDDRRMLVRTARELVRERSPVSALRALRDQKNPDCFDRGLWRELAELGLVGLALPEELGGSGLGYAELGLVMEELGRLLVPTPLLSTVVLSAEALLRAGQPAQRSVLSRVAAGQALLALAVDERPRHQPFFCETRAERSGEGFVLRGKKSFVLDGHVADHLLVVARTAGARDERAGLSLFLVDRTTRGVSTERLGMVDSRGAAHLTLDGVAVAGDALVGPLDGAAGVLEHVLDRACIALSAEMLGSALAAFEMTLDYLKTRRQFGVPIGSFQALKHRAADLYAELELGRSVVMDALCALDEGRADVPSVASIAKARMSDVFVRVTAEALQMHGGIGVTDEHDIGFYYKRARVTELTLGDGNYHRARYATLSGY
jgi:alkylation response protein AidB-like acyl-CoA dehydrogenase